MGTYPCCRLSKIFTGLIFLKYISTAFEKKYAELVAEGDGFEDDPDAYEAENIFFVPPEACWSEIAKAAHTPEIGTILDKAMIAIEADNKSLIGRNVRSVRKVHSGARRKQKQHLSLRTGSQCRHLENGQNEHGNPRNRCKLWRPPGRYFFQRPAFHTEVRLHHGKSALQLKQLGGGRINCRTTRAGHTDFHLQATQTTPG